MASGYGLFRRLEMPFIRVVDVAADDFVLAVHPGVNPQPLTIDTVVTKLNNGSLQGVDCRRLFKRLDDFWATVEKVQGQDTVMNMHIKLPLTVGVPFVTHVTVTLVSPTGISFHSRLLDLFLMVLMADNDDVLQNFSQIRPHQTAIVRAQLENDGSYRILAVEMLPLHKGQGKIHLVKSESSVLIYNQPAANERLPFRYVHVLNDIVRRGDIPINDWHDRPVEFSACIDQPEGSDDFMDGKLYKAIDVCILSDRPRLGETNNYVDRSRRDPTGLELDAKTLDEWRLVKTEVRKETNLIDVMEATMLVDLNESTDFIGDHLNLMDSPIMYFCAGSIYLLHTAHDSIRNIMQPVLMPTVCEKKQQRNEEDKGENQGRVVENQKQHAETETRLEEVCIDAHFS